MSPIPNDIMRKARDLAHVGCGCEDADEAEFSCGHFRMGYCQRAADHIAHAIMDEREKCATIALSFIGEAPDDDAPLDVYEETRNATASAIHAAILKGET